SDELSTSEALDLARQLGEMGFLWITLSGGEPFIRRDWHIIVNELWQEGVTANMISNGWLIDEEILKKAKANHVGTIAISLDGLEQTHDYMRKKGAFKHVVNALKLMNELEVSGGVITTVSKKNLRELPAIKKLLIELDVKYWQIQIGLPMGNFRDRRQMIMEPEQVDDVINFAYETMKEGQITVYPADCLGYYNIKELQVRQKAHKSAGLPIWSGCNAGKRSLGILHNGQVLGCTSIRDREFIEGSIRERPLKEIWEDETKFTWNRNAAKSDLAGKCKICKYGDVCLGGCPNTRLTMNGKIQSENFYCSYNIAMCKTGKDIGAINDFAELSRLGKEYAGRREFQLSAMLLEKALLVEPNNIELLSLLGYVHFFLNNFPESREANRRILILNPDHVYANKGMGLSLHRCGDTEAGISYLKRAIELADPGYLDPYYDLAVVYRECGRIEEIKILQEKVQHISPQLAAQLESFYVPGK
ncbi:MAG: SPASM domain-containing protein, partial [Acidobacteria bacterium]|nr:SPASM domain-containing protein [Acidobacteriota bacterium]